MKKNNLLKILNLKVPSHKEGDIIFINLNKSKKYLNEFYEYSKIDKFFEFFEYSAFKKKVTFNSFLKKLINTEKNNHKNTTYQKFWLIIDNKTDKLIGSAKLSTLDPVRQSVEWGYGINSKLWGKNYILKIQSSLLDYVFHELKLNRLYGHTQVKNKRVIKGVEILGFRKEGIKSDYYYNQSNKNFFDAYTYSFLKKDFLKDKKFIQKNNVKKTNQKISFEEINRIIEKIIKKKVILKKNIKMNDISEWDSLTHFDIISKIEKVFRAKFNNNEILNSFDTKNIIKILTNK